jgi:basic membrane protein A
MKCYGSLLLALLCVCALVVTPACNLGRASTEDRSKIRVGIVFDIGGKDDRSFNASAWEGVKRAAKDFPITLRDVEPGDPTSIEPAMRAFAEKGYDLIIGVGFAQAPIMQDVAADYPNLKFAIIDGLIFKRDAQGKPIEGQFADNAASLVFKEHEGSYLVGMIAAKKSRTGIIGFIGGMDIPLIHRFETGYEEGARAVNPNIRVIENYVGVNDGAWNNPGKGKELAVAQIGKGADVIFTAAGNSGLGAFDAVEQSSNRFVIGVDSNQNWVKPGRVLTSMVKRVDNAVYQIVGDTVHGQFKGGLHVFGLDNEGIGYALDDYNRSLIPPDVLTQVDAAKQKIIAGQIKVTDAMAK